ncbi:MAG: hypothetical protein JNL32_13585 [Candidatus Kapabacteria bacterium]|nr:hypothetical protein [Candidatus Kapabacteria bacterium]
MKLYFNKTAQMPFSKLIAYSSLNPIPAILKLSNDALLPDTIYTRNLAGENFVELRFDRHTKKLYDITIVAVQEDTVKVVDNDKIVEEDFYNCFIADDSIMEISQPITVLRSNSSLCFFWGNQPSQTYSIAENCIIGTDNEKELCSIFLVNLSNELIYEILGF